MYHIVDMWITYVYLSTAQSFDLLGFCLATFMFSVVIYMHTHPTRDIILNNKPTLIQYLKITKWLRKLLNLLFTTCPW